MPTVRSRFVLGNLTSACHPELVEVLRRRSKTEERSSEGIYFTFLLTFVG